MTANPHGIALEPAAQALAEKTSSPPFLHQLPPEQARAAFQEAQRSEIRKPEVDEEWITVSGGPTGEVSVRIVRPKGAAGALPVVLYTHGAGWVLGDAVTHDRLVRDLAVGTGAAVVFPDYLRAPEAKYPSQNEQCYAVAQWILREGAQHGLDPERLAVCGDSVGGNMAIALNLMGHERGDVAFRAVVLFYPVTDAGFDTESYRTFAEGYFLARAEMQWFWDQYTRDEAERAEITASPLRASEEQLAFFPPTLVITAEADVLRDEGEAFAAKLRRAGVELVQTRYGGVLHDFVMLHATLEAPPARAAVAQAVAHLRAALVA